MALPLIELLVVIAIIAVLIGLLLFEQLTRLAGRQSECNAATIETARRFATRGSIAAAFKCTLGGLVGAN
jgi:type II secretory pathway pseudopilin PulG